MDELGRPVRTGEVGEVWVRGPNLLCGYWKDPDSPAFADGWFHTGDLARCDEAGFYEIVGRSKDMIISGGENVYPAEIENLLADCPMVLESAVVGEPDARWGEVVVAVVVRKPGADLDAAQVLQLFDGRLARFKHPKRVVFCDALPKTALGKVRKAGLLASLAAQ
jgi:fatty-acyl-CoA synthase